MNLYFTLLNIVQFIFYAYGYLLIATAVISWIPDLIQTQLGQVLLKASEPYLAGFRKILRPVRIGGASLDLSFVVGVVVYFAILTYALTVFFNVLRT